MEELNLECSIEQSLTCLAVTLCSDLHKAKELKMKLRNGVISKEKALSEIIENWYRGNEAVNKSKLKAIAAVIKSSGFPVLAEKVASWMDPSEVSPTPEQMALSNCVILEQIFKNLSFQDQKSFRIVNRICYRETLPHWRRNVQLSIINLRDYAIPSQVRKSNLYMDEFVEFAKQEKQREMEGMEPSPGPLFNLLKYPFRNFHIFKNVFLEQDNPGAKYEADFWELFTSKVRQITFSEIESDWSAIPEIINRLFATCPEIKHVQFDGTCGKGKNEDGRK